ASTLWHHLLEEFQLLPGEIRAKIAHARDIPDRARQAGDELQPNWLTAVHHDRDGTRGMLGSPGWGASTRHNHLHRQTHQLGRQVAEPLFAALCIAVLDEQVLALDEIGRATV